MSAAIRSRAARGGPVRRGGLGAGVRGPGRAVVVGFAVAALVGTGLLSLPWATAAGQRAPWSDALFTAVSAVCVTGLATVDTGTYWSAFGQVVILLLVQTGGLGFMTLASLLALLLSHRLGLRARLLAQTETKTLSAGDVRRVIARIVAFSLVTEAVLAVVLTVRFATAHGFPPLRAAWYGVFHAVSAFNNAGFGLHADSLVRYASDALVCLPIAAAVILGGLGFPVVFELARSWRRPRSWSVLTRITVLLTVVLLVLGTLAHVLLERTNPATLGGRGPGATVLAAFFASAMARTAGFNSLDIAALRPETLFATDVLMFIGGGSAGTAGGIKVTTFGVLAYVLWAEVRGDTDVEVGRRRVPATNQRQALAVALLGVGLVTASTLALLVLSEEEFYRVLFEAVSAFATVGLSTGITAGLDEPARLVLVLLMFLGRVGPLSLASALALRERGRRHRLPEERTIVG
ncbi:TrkH family potassium uptake protein [Kineococcus auxinigenes]|uniref:TrkH family potassium uptake protein n=1 Tax=unclassified Kineococcus TaxID=2621656 RepID=UPI003D7C5EB4